MLACCAYIAYSYAMTISTSRIRDKMAGPWKMTRLKVPTWSRLIGVQATLKQERGGDVSLSEVIEQALDALDEKRSKAGK